MGLSLFDRKVTRFENKLSMESPFIGQCFHSLILAIEFSEFVLKQAKKRIGCHLKV